MSRHTSVTRAVALWAMLSMPWAVTGPGVHDPDCPHHKAGASGTAHVAAMTHAGHAGHQQAPSSGSGGGADEDCHCLGPCVLGAHAGPAVPAGGLAQGVAGAPAVPAALVAAGSRPLAPVPFRLPFATGPPRTA